MMKRLMALLAVALLFLCGTAGLAEMAEDCVGVWEMQSVELYGFEADRGMLGYAIRFFVHEDGMGVLVKKDDFGMVKLIPDGDGYCWMVGEEKSTMYVDAEGFMHIAMVIDGLTMNVKLHKVPADDFISEAAAPIVGRWTMEQMGCKGRMMDAETLDATMLVDVYADGYGCITMDGEWFPVRFLLKDGRLMMLDDSGCLDNVALMEDRRLYIAVQDGGMVTEFYLKPVAAEMIRCDLCGKDGPAAENHVFGTVNFCGACYSALFD